MDSIFLDKLKEDYKLKFNDYVFEIKNKKDQNVSFTSINENYNSQSVKIIKDLLIKYGFNDKELFENNALKLHIDFTEVRYQIYNLYDIK